jgi:hypothetical protein
MVAEIHVSSHFADSVHSCHRLLLLSKRVFESELKNSGSGRTQNSAKGTASQRGVRVAEVCVVEDVEALKPEVDALRLREVPDRNREGFSQAEIQIFDPGSTHDVPQSAEFDARRIWSERGCVEPLEQLRTLRPVAGQVRIPNYGSPVAADAIERVVNAGSNGERQPSAQGQNAARLPSADHFPAEEAEGGEFWKLPDIRENELLIDVIIG